MASIPGTMQADFEALGEAFRNFGTTVLEATGAFKMLEEHLQDFLYVDEEEELPIEQLEMFFDKALLQREMDVGSNGVFIRVVRHGDGRINLYLGNCLMGELGPLRERPMRKFITPPVGAVKWGSVKFSTIKEKPKNVRLIRE